MAPHAVVALDDVAGAVVVTWNLVVGGRRPRRERRNQPPGAEAHRQGSYPSPPPREVGPLVGQSRPSLVAALVHCGRLTPGPSWPLPRAPGRRTGPRSRPRPRG